MDRKKWWQTDLSCLAIEIIINICFKYENEEKSSDSMEEMLLFCLFHLKKEDKAEKFES